MCFGDGNDAAKDAKKAEEARQATISSNVSGVNSAFAGREPQYTQFGEALRQRLNTELARQREVATRQTKFGLARSGLVGGSAAKDAGKLLAREGQEGVLNAERQAQRGIADLRSADEQARTQLISLAQSGSDIGNAASQAGSMLRANLGSAQSAVQPLGEAFAAATSNYRTQRDAAERRRGLADAQVYANPFSRGP